MLCRLYKSFDNKQQRTCNDWDWLWNKRKTRKCVFQTLSMLTKWQSFKSGCYLNKSARLLHSTKIMLQKVIYLLPASWISCSISIINHLLQKLSKWYVLKWKNRYHTDNLIKQFLSCHLEEPLPAAWWTKGMINMSMLLCLLLPPPQIRCHRFV
jgi:hypothetical protein